MLNEDPGAYVVVADASAVGLAPCGSMGRSRIHRARRHVILPHDRSHWCSASKGLSRAMPRTSESRGRRAPEKRRSSRRSANRLYRPFACY